MERTRELCAGGVEAAAGGEGGDVGGADGGAGKHLVALAGMGRAGVGGVDLDGCNGMML